MESAAEVIQSYPPEARKHVGALRRLISERAEALDLELVETLKWGQPAFLTKTKSGSTIRLGWTEKQPRVCAMYFICTTTLVEGFRAQFKSLCFEGNRAIVLPLDQALPLEALASCVDDALTYHKK